MSSTLLSVIRLIVLFSLIPWSYASNTNNFLDPRLNQAIILQYHHVSDFTPAHTSISPAQFAKHLQLIDDLKFDVKPLDYVIEHIQSGVPFPRKTLAITFDDGYDSIYENAYPLLKSRLWPFTIFISPKAIEHSHGSTMSWQQIREMTKHGVTIANHSWEHLHLLQRKPEETQEQWTQRITQDIERAQNKLTQELDTAPNLFAYPYGEFDEDLKSILKQSGYIAFGQQSGPVHYSSDLQALPRFPASGIYANVNTLTTKLNSLAFSVDSIEPKAVIRSVMDAPPTLKLTAQDNGVRFQQSQCFYAGSPIPTKANKQGEVITIETQFKGKLTAGRSRYNCTAPSNKVNGYYWFSIPFITLNEEKNWID